MVLGSQLWTKYTEGLGKGALQDSEVEDSFPHFIDEKNEDLKTE